MKKFLILILVVLSLSSCYKAYSELNVGDANKYVHFQSNINSSEENAYLYSPLAYQFYKGENPYSGYTIKSVTISFGGWNLYGDPLPLLNAAFPDADIILSFGQYYYIGYKPKVAK
jgi:hypothetical protein